MVEFFFWGGGTLWRGKRGARSRPENYGGEGGGLWRGRGKEKGGGAVAPWGLRGGERRRVEEGGGEKRREGARSRLGDYGGGKGGGLRRGEGKREGRGRGRA